MANWTNSRNSEGRRAILWGRGVFSALVLFCLIVGIANLAALSQATAQVVEVKLTQAGFAGDTGNGWRINTSGNWTAFRITLDDKEAVYAKGKLKPKQVGVLKEALDQYNFDSLPNKLGQYEKANPETLTIQA